MIFLWTIGRITHEKQNLETQGRHCITVTSSEKSTLASEKRHCFLRWGKRTKARGGLIKQQKASKKKEYSLRKIQFTQSWCQIGLEGNIVVVENYRVSSSFRARKNDYSLKFEDYSP